MVHTTKNYFNSGTDWIPVTSSNLVFSGSVDFVDHDWTTITLTILLRIMVPAMWPSLWMTTQMDIRQFVKISWFLMPMANPYASKVTATIMIRSPLLPI